MVVRDEVDALRKKHGKWNRAAENEWLVKHGAVKIGTYLGVEEIRVIPAHYGRECARLSAYWKWWLPHERVDKEKMKQYEEMASEVSDKLKNYNPYYSKSQL